MRGARWPPSTLPTHHPVDEQPLLAARRVLQDEEVAVLRPPGVGARAHALTDAGTIIGGQAGQPQVGGGGHTNKINPFPFANKSSTPFPFPFPLETTPNAKTWLSTGHRTLALCLILYLYRYLSKTK